MYVQVVPADSAGSYSSGIEVYGSNYKIHDSSFDNMQVCILVSYQDGDTNPQIYNNTFNHFNWGVTFGNNGSQHVSNISIHDNHFLNMDNWDNTSTWAYHHDGIFLFNNDCVNGGVSNSKIYNNLFDGKQGVTATAWIYTNCGIHGAYIFNNMLINDGSGQGYAIITGLVSTDSNIYVLNNTIRTNNNACLKALAQTGLIWENNAVQGCYTYWVAEGTQGSPTVDYNAFDSSAATSTHAFAWDAGANTYAFYKARHPTLDIHSITAASLGLDASSRPSVGSALIGKGTNLTSLGIPELNLDRAGFNRPSGTAPWDIGATNSVATSVPSRR
jgi:hypothetical protein